MKLLCHQRVGEVVYYHIGDVLVGGVLVKLLCHQRVAKKCCFWGMGDTGEEESLILLCHHIVERSFLDIGWLVRNGSQGVVK
jgi:hypothetical protein